MIHLNPVTGVVDSVKSGLVAVITRLEQLLGSDKFKEILTTDATTEDGENKVAEYFKIENAWEHLLENGNRTTKILLVSSDTTSSYFL
jgi:hypothetical protein